jgi:hypothetical protein
MSLKNVNRSRQITAADSKEIKDHLDIRDIDLQSLKHNDNILLMGMRSVDHGEEVKGKEKVKYTCLAECRSTKKVPIQIYSFDKDLGIQNLRKGTSFFVKGKLNYFRTKTNRTFYSIYVEKLEKKKR